MNREQLEHILRAAYAITGEARIVVMGSQAILAQGESLPRELTESYEVDVFTFRSPEDADLIDGTIGEQSPFHRTFGYYAHGIGPETAILPPGWEERLVAIQSENTRGAIGLLLEAHDLAVAKLAAGRDKDIEFVGIMLIHGIANKEIMHKRIESLMLDNELKDVYKHRLRLAAERSR